MRGHLIFINWKVVVKIIWCPYHSHVLIRPLFEEFKDAWKNELVIVQYGTMHAILSLSDIDIYFNKKGNAARCSYTM